jgi:hypothetical protein
MQLGSGRRPGKRWSSWYDEELVVQDGEDILSRLDNWAIVTLRAHRLVWSGWGAETYVPVRRMPPKLGRLTYRTVSGIDLQRLRLFFLILLWRAAATTRPEFAEIVLPAADLNKLGRMVIENNSKPVDFYPMALVQLSTRGPPHNLSPIAEQKPIPNLPGLGHQNRPFFPAVLIVQPVIYLSASGMGLVEPPSVTAYLAIDAILLLIQHALIGAGDVAAVLRGHVALFLANLMIVAMKLPGLSAA